MSAISQSYSTCSFPEKNADFAKTVNVRLVRVSIVETDRCKGAVWFRRLVAGSNDRFGDMSCNAATAIPRPRSHAASALAA